MGKTITVISDLIKEIKKNPPKIVLCKSLYDWLLRSNWDCVLSDELKNYIKNGGNVIRYDEEK